MFNPIFFFFLSYNKPQILSWSQKQKLRFDHHDFFNEVQFSLQGICNYYIAYDSMNLGNVKMNHMLKKAKNKEKKNSSSTTK